MAVINLLTVLQDAYITEKPNLFVLLPSDACNDLRLGHSFLDAHAMSSDVNTVAGQRLVFTFEPRPD